MTRTVADLKAVFQFAREWWVTVVQLSDPSRRAVLLGKDIQDDDLVEVERPAAETEKP